MKIIETQIKGLLILELDAFKDTRGYFSETFNKKRFSDYGIHETFVQDNISLSKKGTLRGLHYQVPPKAQAKLCQVLKGSVLDVAVDLRVGSPTFGQHFSITLTDENHTQLFIPQGFAHGFAALSEEVIFHYKCTEYYSKEHERAIRFDDTYLNINWEVGSPIVSDKDRNAKLFVESERVFQFNQN